MSIEQFTVGDRVTYEVEGVTYAGVVSVYVMPDWKVSEMRLLGLRWESVAFWGKKQARLTVVP